MMSNGSSADKSKRPLGPYQFSLRRLLALMTLCCLMLGLLTWRSCIPTIALAIAGPICLVDGIRRGQWVKGIVVMVACLILAVLLQEGVSAGSGRGWFVVPIRVVDAATGKAIANAEVRRIRYVTGGNAQAPTTRTARDGLVNLAVQMHYNVYGRHFLFGPDEMRRTIDVSGELEIIADGYEPARIWLAEQLGTDRWDRNGPGFPEIQVELHGKAAASPPADDLVPNETED